MMDLIDTNLFVARIRGDPRAIRFFRRYRGRPFYASVITRLELMLGLRPDEFWKTQRLLRRVKWIPVTEEIADQAAIYMAQYSKTHGLTLADALIAATAKSVGARLVTLDRDFFPMTDLRVYMPY
ncbi:MAG: type II toxin-antitoxin system VapC family toxin [Armatimonadota bacterium]